MNTYTDAMLDALISAVSVPHKTKQNEDAAADDDDDSGSNRHPGDENENAEVDNKDDLLAAASCSGSKSITGEEATNSNTANTSIATRDSTPPIPRLVVTKEDRDLIPDALFVALGQMKPCRLKQADRVGCYKARPIGFIGFCCKVHITYNIYIRCLFTAVEMFWLSSCW